MVTTEVDVRSHVMRVLIKLYLVVGVTPFTMR